MTQLKMNISFSQLWSWMVYVPILISLASLKTLNADLIINQNRAEEDDKSEEKF